MAIIGNFKATENGYAGTIETLTLKAEVEFEPVERKSSDKAPDFRIFTKKSGFEIGAAWGTALLARPERTTFRSNSTIPALRLPFSAAWSRPALNWVTAFCGTAGVPDSSSGRLRPPHLFSSTFSLGISI